MVNTTNQDGGQNPPQGTDTSNAIPISQAITVATNTVAIGSSNSIPTGTMEMPSNLSLVPILTNVGTQAQQYSTPIRPLGFDAFRPRNPQYGMPTSFMAGLHTASTSAPIQGSSFGMNHLGPNTHNLGSFTQIPTLTTNNQAAFR